MNEPDVKDANRATLLYGRSPQAPAPARKSGNGWQTFWRVCGVLFVFLVIAAIVLPVIAQTREKTHNWTCLSNMKQLGNAAAMYVQDWDDQLPPVREWTSELYPYIKSEPVFRCPQDETVGRSSYGMNWKLNIAPLDRLLKPDSTVLFYEAEASGFAPFGGPSAVVSPGRHDGATNYVYADGHAVTVPPGPDARVLGWIPKFSPPPRHRKAILQHSSESVVSVDTLPPFPGASTP